jgi:murein DD-endopeptidase MepM/ murein hydrolase activator NlpD
MGIFGLPPSFVATLLIMWAPPPASEVPTAEPKAEEAPQQAPDKPVIEVLAASPLPAEFAPGSGYGYRASPRTGRRTFHAGADFNAPGGTPVYAVRAGIVEHVPSNRGRVFFNGYGNAVVVYHPDLDQWSFYAHLRETFVQPGDVVTPGQRIGSVGNTTNGRFPRMGAHLHFEVRRRAPNGQAPFPGSYRSFNVDPERWLTEQGIRWADPLALDPAMPAEAPIFVVRAVPSDAAQL